MEQTPHRKEDLMKDESYGLEGEFFVTIRANGEQGFLSAIEEGNSVLTKSGKVAEKYWLEIERHFANVSLKEYVIMPNHLHGIISLKKNPEKKNKKIRDVSRFEVSFGLMMGRNNPFMLKGSIFHIISWYKAASLIEIRRHFHEEFSWKPGYFDFFIKNETSLRNIRDYIRKDPQNWEDDLDNPENNFRDILFPEK